MFTEQRGETDTERIEYRQILDQIEERVNSLWSIQVPNITLIAHPVLPETQLIEVDEIYEYWRESATQRFVFNEPPVNEERGFTKRVPGGVAFVGVPRKLYYQELNERGIVYFREELWKCTCRGDESKRHFILEDLIRKSCEVLAAASDYYERCWIFTGDIIVTARLRHLSNEGLASDKWKMLTGHDLDLMPQGQSADSEIFASVNCCASDIKMKENAGNRSSELVGRLLQGFNVDVKHPGWTNAVLAGIKKYHQGD